MKRLVVTLSGLAVALVMASACTPGEPTPTMPFEESALAQQHGGDLATVIIGQVVQKTHEQSEPSPSHGIGCPCTDRYGFWRVKVERYLANPQPYDEITYKAIEETTRSDGTPAVRWGTQPPLPREGERAVFFLERRITSLYPLLIGDTYGGFQAIKPIEDGLVDVGSYGGIHFPRWVPLDDFADSIVAMASQPATPESAIDSSPATATPPSTLRTDEVRLVLGAQPVEGSVRSFEFVAEIVGGPDNNRDVYCTGDGWDFGDGIAMMTMPMCIPWEPDWQMPRHFEQTHTYAEPGEYEITVTRGPLEATLMLEVQ